MLDVTVVDVTGHPDAGRFLDFTGEPRGSGIEALGFEPDAINVYAARELEPGTTPVLAGRAEIGRNMTMVADVGWGRATFIHEIGHNLGLKHPNNLDGFGDDNVMWSPSGARRVYFTEGQAFRIHFNRESALNAEFDLLPFATQSACSSGYGYWGRRCPEESLRLFADSGAAPAAPPSVPGQELPAVACGTEPPIPAAPRR